MASALGHVKEEWQLFKHDPPGLRFSNHRHRMKDRSRKHTALAVAIGIALLVGGFVLLFMPGPGLLLIVFGLGLVASQSERLADWLDRTETRLRRIGHHTMQRWIAMSGAAKVSLIVGMAVAIASAGLLVWKLVLGTYVLGLLS